ncbi:MAG: hypothetical protein K8J09_14255 [Planctomycetes bacterium]|nr:hypothetical protein [Planctomycetota bacterium]MCC7396811.1 hypothetical protein [Planctomycetota bacterium]
MSTITDLPLGVGGAPAAAPTPATTTTATSGQFQELLERLQRLAEQHRTVPPVEDADQLQAAMRSADDGFQVAMDLRRQLEDAFRRHSS